MEDYFERQETFSNRSEPIFNPQRLPEKYLSTQTRKRQPTEKGLQYQIELKQKSLGTVQSLFYNMAGAKHNRATTFIELIRGGSTQFLKQISTGQKLFISSR